MKDWLERQLQARLGVTSPVARIEKIQGDASYRIYSRIFCEDASTYILMQMPPGKAEASEEISHHPLTLAHPHDIPFINIATALRSRGLPVPQVLWYDSQESALLLEDLGGESLATQLATDPPGRKVERYRQAIDLLVRVQQVMDVKDPACVAYQRSFDATLLNWEFLHFLEYGIEARIGRVLEPLTRRCFIESSGVLTEALLEIPIGFVHRDYQSRNLMMKGGRYYLIDFQDALMGPYLYDLVALLRDSYASLSTDELALLIGYYRQTRAAAFGGAEELESLWRQFHLLTIQRKLKDAGRFVYIDKVKGNPNFLKFIPASLGYAKTALKALDDIPACRQLNESIGATLTEWHNL